MAAREIFARVVVVGIPVLILMGAVFTSAYRVQL
jgi:hypothetical protein